MESRDGIRKEYLDAIKEKIRNGELVFDQVTAQLGAAVEAELDKPLSAMDEEYLLACQDLQYDLLISEEYTSKQPEYERKLIKEIHRHNRAKVIRKRIVQVAGIAALIIVLLGVGDGLLYREWLSGVSTDDEQKYRIEGNIFDPNLVADGKATHYVEGEDFTTTDFDDVIAFWGSAPPMPIWLPEEWAISEYNCLYRVDGLWVVVQMENTDGDFARYDIIRFEDAESAAWELEQMSSGLPDIINEQEVYFAENTNNTVATWNEGSVCYTIMAPISYEHMVTLIENIEYGG